MATKRTSSPRKDFTQVALSVVQQAAGELTATAQAKKLEGRRKTAGAKKSLPAKKPA